MKFPTFSEIAQKEPEAIHRLYACEQATEILGRTGRVVDRVMPNEPTPHGFYDFEGFIASSRLASHRRLFARSVQQRIKAKVEARDKRLTAEEKAMTMEKRTISYGPLSFRYRGKNLNPSQMR